MGVLYHGSPVMGLNRLETNDSTHGNYLYATPDKDIATIFAGKCGDDLTSTIYRNSKGEPWNLVERMPGVFDTMYNNSASLYVVDDSTFKDIHSSFNELVSEVGVNVLASYNIANVYDKIKELELQGKIKIYNYPSRPKEIPDDDSDLIEKEINHCKRKNIPITKGMFARLVFLHPNLMPLVNKKLSEYKVNGFSDDDIVQLYENNIVNQMLEPSHERYIKSAFIALASSYPNLVPIVRNKLNIFFKSKEEKVSIIVDNKAKMMPNINEDMARDIKNRYFDDQRDINQICSELNVVFKELNTKPLEKNKVRVLSKDGGFVNYILISLLTGIMIGVVAALSYVFIRG